MRKTYIVFSDENKTFSYLNSFNNKTNSFEGEYSLIHNTYSKDHFFLNRFLIQNENTPVILISDDTNEYSKIIRQYEHLFEDDVSKYVEEKLYKEGEKTQGLFKKRGAEEFDFSIFKKFIEEELADLKTERPADIEDRYLLEGQKLFAKKVLRIVNELEEKRKIK